MTVSICSVKRLGLLVITVGVAPVSSDRHQIIVYAIAFPRVREKHQPYRAPTTFAFSARDGLKQGCAQAREGDGAFELTFSRGAASKPGWSEVQPVRGDACGHMPVDKAEEMSLPA